MIDLDRLGEALAGWIDEPGFASEPEVVVLRCAETVLSAPTVWWCEGIRGGYKVACGHAPDVGCRYVALVSVDRGRL